MIRALVADDEAPAREELKHLLKGIEGIEVVGEARDGPAAYDQIAKLKPDVVFLDIHMPGLSGIEVARAISDLDPAPRIVFVTAYDQYAVEAFETEALDYILKPVETERLEAAIERVRRAIETRAPSSIGSRIEDILSRLGGEKAAARKISIKKAGKVHLSDPREVIYFTVEDAVVRAVGAMGSGSAPYRSLDEAEKNLPESFFRANRTHLVNLDSISEIIRAKEGSWELVMTNRDTVPLSRAQARKLRKFIKW